MGWAMYLFNYFFVRHLHKLRSALIEKPSAEAANDAESSTLLSATLPAWCAVDLTKPRPWWKKCLSHAPHNRQQALYWMGSEGPHFYLLILQINLIFVGIYAAMHVLAFFHYVVAEDSTLELVLYLIFSIIPAIGILVGKKDLVATLAQVCSVGCYRRPQVVAQVLIEQKTASVVQAFFLLYKLTRSAAHVKEQHGHSASTGHGAAEVEPWVRARVEKSFKALESGGDGSLSREELASLLGNLGANLSSEDVERIINALDKDSSGKVSLEEFLSWYARTSDDGHLSHKERAEYLFEMFDEDKSGEITIEEFKRRMDALNIGFSVNEVGALINELDENNNGTIGTEEFEHLLHKFGPASAHGGHGH